MRLHHIFPCLRYPVGTNRTAELEREATEASKIVAQKRRDIHRSAIEFESTIREMLDDNDRIRAAKK